jgi:hypothetical protein
MKGTQPFKEKEKTRVPRLVPAPTFFAWLVSGPLFSRVENEIAEDEDNEISEEKNDQSGEDGDDLLVELHSRPSWTKRIAII